MVPVILKMVALPPTTLMAGSGDKQTGYGSVDQLAIVVWIVSGALFLRSSGSVHRC
jgi:hypothetical protein